ncbi:MAG: fibrillarin-like rRNA/tRNA 2'-O-methyltransferase [Thaumarchaeota archaeon]|nr:fibrillarin-like rRNA/tRNA 2'-O-methyltransferase [Nitrososphaerota archaeon]
MGDRLAWFEDGSRRPATKNLVKGDRVYGERLVYLDGEEYRLWNPYRSKLSAALLKGLKQMPIREGTKVLYLGASTGTTVSHVSDLVGDEGIVFAVEVSPRVMREFIERVAKKRGNVVPILEDARKPLEYPSVFTKVDVVYCDVAQADQTEIAIENSKVYLRRHGYLMLIVKARSIDVTKKPSFIFEREVEKLKRSGFEIIQIVSLEPYDKDHALILARRQ